MLANQHSAERALVLAPLGRDSEVAARMLAEGGLAAFACSDIAEMITQLEQGAGVAVVTEEALAGGDLRDIAAWIDKQPEWSDFPFVLLTHRGGGLERNPVASRLLRTLGNVTFLERPFHPTTLISLVEAALRGRRRQYEARLRLDLLRESELQFRTLADSIPTLCWTARPDGHIYWYNQKWYDYTGTTPEDMEGWGWRSVHDPRTLPDVIERWQHAIATGELFEMVFPLRAADGSFHPFLTRIEPVRNAAGAVTGWFGTNTDITSQRAAEEHLRKLADDLEARVDERTREREQALAQLHEAQKLESIGQLTGGVAHDFNNLLTPVIGNLELLRRRIDADEKAQRYVDSALQASSRAATLVQRLLAFARRQDLQPRPVDVAALVQGIQDLIDRTIGPSIDVKVEVGEDLPPAFIDPNQLELAILNLSINARDAMPKGGGLSITLVKSEPPADLAANEAGFLCLSVADTGAGMDAATLKRAFEPFFSTKGPGKGTGLGLSMVHGMVAQSGGLFRLFSEPDAGTRAELWLPCSSEAAQVEAPATAEPTASPENAQVLLVDDEDLVREGTCQLLAELGYGVTMAASGAEAIVHLQSNDNFDLLITDYLMPQMNGAQLAREAKRLQPSLPVLLITGYANLELGADDSLVRLAKPFQYADLANRVSELITSARRTGGEGLEPNLADSR